MRTPCAVRSPPQAIRSFPSSRPPMRRRASSPSESKRHAGCTFILGRLDRHPVARGAGGLSSDWREHPPRKSSRLSRSRRLWRSYFAAKAGLFWEWAGHRRLSLSADQVLFLPVRTEAYRGQFASESFYGTLVRMEMRKPRGRPCVLCTPTWESPSPVPGMILVC